jgi:hypothetical protein
MLLGMAGRFGDLRTRLGGRWRSIVLASAILALVLAFVLHIEAANGPTIPGSPGMTLSDLTQSVRSELTSNAKRDHIPAFTNVVCHPPSLWKQGATFTCYTFDSEMKELGEFDGVAKANLGGEVRWSGVWRSLDGT